MESYKVEWSVTLSGIDFVIADNEEEAKYQVKEAFKGNFGGRCGTEVLLDVCLENYKQTNVTIEDPKLGDYMVNEYDECGNIFFLSSPIDDQEEIDFILGNSEEE